jgi:hypothetical protein
MKFELDLLDNSYDYLYNSFDLYKIADEYGEHKSRNSKLENKTKWKLAYISLIQAMELLLKESLNRLNPILVYENIDSIPIKTSKTVSFEQAINRLMNFKKDFLDDNNKAFIIGCIKKRNEFIHYRVEIETEALKAKYCKFYILYKEIHLKIIGKGINFVKKDYQLVDFFLTQFAKDMTVFRGEEMKKFEVEDFTRKIEENHKYGFYIDEEGNKFSRIKYGQENEIYYKSGRTEYILSTPYFEYCDDCLAKQGEYHYENCDIEVCPKCLRQKLSCDCKLKLVKVSS